LLSVCQYAHVSVPCTIAERRAAYYQGYK